MCYIFPMVWDAIVIGAGPAGLAAGYAASKSGAKVLILEKNPKAGKKLFITGKGRCNVTNACDEREFLSNVVRNPHFLHAAYRAFSPADMMEFLTSQGVEVVVERGKRVFPKSYRAYEVTDALVNANKTNGVSFHFQEEVLGIEDSPEGFTVHTNRATHAGSNVVICTGGLAYPSTGSTGDGYRFAKNFGHEISPLSTGLTGLRVNSPFPKEMVNLHLKNVELHAKTPKKRYSEFGELTFREDYLDGPITLTLSSYLALLPPQEVELRLDLKPALSEEKLYLRIQRDIESNPRSSLSSLLGGLLPHDLIPFVLLLVSKSGTEIVSTLSSSFRRELAHFLKNVPFQYLGNNPYPRAIITVGGVSTKEVDASTMESKFIPGLYFGGEVLDLDALTGGFNIQIALSTGFLAGRSIAETLN